MKIGPKAILIAISGGLLTLLLAFLAMEIYIIPNIKDEENLQAIHKYQIIEKIIDNEKDKLTSTALDWSQWDDTYQFIENKNQIYVRNNLQPSSLESLDINFLLFTTNSGYPIHIVSYDPDMADSEITEKLLAEINFNDISELFFMENGNSAGLISVDGRPALAAISTITTSDQTAPPNGYLILGKFISGDLINYTEDITETEIDLENAFPNSLFDILGEKYFQILSDDQSYWITVSSDYLITASLIEDIYGNKTFPFVLSKPRQLYKSTVKSFHLFVIGIIFFLIIAMVISLHAADQLILKRLQKLNRFVNTIIEKNDTKTRIYMSGNDEFSEFSLHVNKMLDNLDEAISETKESEERQRLIMEATSDGYFDIDIMQKTMYVSPKWNEHIGKDNEKSEIKLKDFINFVAPQDQEKVRDKFARQLSDSSIDVYNDEYRLILSNKSIVWISVKSRIVKRDINGKPLRMVGTISDITLQKSAESQTKYLKETDTITGLKNRNFIEPIFKEASECGKCNYSIILIDINGLKLINDSYGKTRGDEILKSMGMMLKKICGSGQVPVRWGGDEFLIFIKNDSDRDTEELVNKINDKIKSNLDFPMAVSISAGWAKKSKKLDSIEPLIKHAEEKLNRNKLLKDASQKNAIISSLTQTLYEKHIETEEHIQRTKKLCRLIGERFGFVQDEIDELELLGTLHDIGKVGIPESVLLKPTKLDEDEWAIMTKHTEIGYRIAVSTPDLAHIAEGILYHHEKYDGTGYPLGLSGQQIPKLSRLLAIVDAYDVMVHNRVYKKAISKEKAIETILESAGTHFDPQMAEEFVKMIKGNKSL